MSTPPRRDLVGTDFSMASQHAVEAAAGLPVADVRLVYLREER